MTSAPESRPPLSQLAAETLRMLPHIAKLFGGVVRDPRVPRVAKWQAGALVAIGLSPIDAIPVLGQTELVAAVALAARQLLKHTDESVLRAHWTGTDRQFTTLLWLADTGLRPGRMAMRALGSAVRGRGRR